MGRVTRPVRSVFLFVCHARFLNSKMKKT